MKRYTLYRDGDFYKGNLHAHTNLSDGKITPEETIARYKQNGYDFLAISDHMIYGYYPEHEDEDFLSIPAAEIHTFKNGVAHHLLAIGDPETTQIPMGKVDPTLNRMEAQELIDYIRARQNLAIYCHPHWSRVGFEKLISLKDFIGIEIYNHECEMGWRSGKAEVFYDHLCWHGKRVWCFATDDTHSKDYTFCGGYITVKTPDFSHKGILKAIEEGSFFASSAREGAEAPRILDFICEDGIAQLRCDPCRDVYFYFGCNMDPKVWSYRYRSTHAKEENPISYVEQEIPKEAKYVKVSIQDFSGHNSWCQPLWLTDESQYKGGA
jgi:hypothetical protein